MRKPTDFIRITDEMHTRAGDAGVLFRTTDSDVLDGRLLRVDGREVVNFGSCSYLGLELDERLKEGAIDAIRRYGTQFSSSRGYMSLPLYGELEALLEAIYGLPTLVAPTTTLAHATALPILIEERDAVLIDQQAHHSLQQGLNLVRLQGTPVEVLRHNDLDAVEARLTALAARHRRIWYLADGVYSMFGDVAPVPALAALLARHERLHLYLDDAHGMSWAGSRGQGWVLSQLPAHERMVVASSLAKGFGVCGGTIATTSAELRRKLRTVGAAFLFSGPMQPANLGAAVAAARLHLDGSLGPMQAELMARLAHCNRRCQELGLPLVSPAAVPIRFIGAGSPAVIFKLMPQLLAEGHYTNGAVFPAVPMTRAGIRFTITRHQTLQDLDALLGAIAHHLPRALAEEGLDLAATFATFDLPAPTHAAPAPELRRRVPADLLLERHGSIDDLDAAEWDALLGSEGTFSAAGLRSLEAAFRDGPPGTPDRWGFDYLIVREPGGRPVLATFFTTAIWKDDMLASAEVSARIERRRRDDPRYLTATTVAMGSPLTEGRHLYLDRAADWRRALGLLLDEAERLRRAAGAPSLLVRDLPPEDEAIGAYLLDRGFARFRTPDSHLLDLAGDEPAQLAALSKDHRRALRKKVLAYDDWYDVEVLGGPTGRRPDDAELAWLHGLYRNVAGRSFDVNGFELPPALFAAMREAPCWEFLTLRLRPAHGGRPDGPPVAFTACFRGPDLYVPHVCGLDYDFVASHGAYRQLNLQAVRRARALGYRQVRLGFGADVEKARLGCRPVAQLAYLRTDDDFRLAALQAHYLERPGS